MTKRRIFSVRELAYAALFTALTAVCAWISVPFGQIAFTMQTFAIFLACGLLPTKTALLSVFAYIILGAAGVPVFSGFRGGAGVLLGVTGGYIVGFLFSVLTTGPLVSLCEKRGLKGFARYALEAAAMLAGLFVCYAFGTAWFMLVYASGAEKSISLAFALSTCVVPYIAPDILKIALAILLTERLKKHIKL